MKTNETQNWRIRCFVCFVNALIWAMCFFFQRFKPAEDLNLEFSYIDANFTNTTGGLNAVRTSASNRLWWAAGLKWWEFLWKYLMWNDGLDSLFVFTIERIKNEEGKASNLRAGHCAKGFGTSASSFPGLLQAVLPCGDHGIVSYSITKHHHVTCYNVKKMPNKRFRDNPTWLLPIWSILSFSELSDFFHQLCAKKKMAPLLSSWFHVCFSIGRH